MQQLNKMLATVLATAVISSPVIGGEHDHDHHADHGESHSAHVHGNAELHLVLEANQLSLELHSPAMNLVGFEHEAKSHEQKAAVKSAQSKLANANELFVFKNGGCTLTNQSADFSSIIKADDDHHEDHHDAHEEHASSNESHSDIEATYQFTCNKPDKLRSITVNFHDAFPGITSLEVQWIAHSKQGAATLNHSNNNIVFK